MTAQYIYVEPDMVTAYADITGEVHKTREDAISASVKADMRAALRSFISDKAESDTVYIAIEQLATDHLSLLRAFVDEMEW